MTNKESEVDVVTVMRRVCTALNDEGLHTDGDNLCVATRAVAEVFEAASYMLCPSYRGPDQDSLRTALRNAGVKA